MEGKTGLALAASQWRVVRLARQARSVISGGPGVGKMTLANSILLILRGKRVRVTLCVPTARAAKRLSESTGLKAKPIRRLLEFDPKFDGFKHDRGNPLETDLIVIDKSFMVDIALMNRPLSTVSDQTVLMMVGDMDQFPSVGPGLYSKDCGLRSRTAVPI